MPADEESAKLVALLKPVFKTRRSLAKATIEKKWQQCWGAFCEDSFQRLIQLGVVVETSDDAEVMGHQIPEGEVAEKPKSFSAGQQEAFEQIIAGIESSESKPQLLFGITGSGKTELYLQLISWVFSQNDGDAAQALVLVPEISLTPQTTKRFEARFPGQVAVVHSGQTPVVRSRCLDSIRKGGKRILIGPRSAVFAPFQALKVIIIDEEHDASYKQSTGFSYNGRDVAVLRASREKAPVILGSATPSIESYNNAINNKYQLVKLFGRHNQHGLPNVSVVGGSVSRAFRTLDDDHSQIPIESNVIRAIEKNLADRHQTIVIINRRGYAYYLYNLVDNEPVKCPNCSISLTVHKRKSLLRCHYCDYSSTVDRFVNGEQKRYAVVGYGSEQLESILGKCFPEASIGRLDSDNTVSKTHLNKTLSDFRKGAIDILVGTQMLAKGHDFPKVTLMIVLELDQALSMPDFRAGERVFQLMVQASGRAGRAEASGNSVCLRCPSSCQACKAASYCCR